MQSDGLLSIQDTQLAFSDHPPNAPSFITHWRLSVQCPHPSKPFPHKWEKAMESNHNAKLNNTPRKISWSYDRVNLAWRPQCMAQCTLDFLFRSFWDPNLDPSETCWHRLYGSYVNLSLSLSTPQNFLLAIQGKIFIPDVSVNSRKLNKE